MCFLNFEILYFQNSLLIFNYIKNGFIFLNYFLCYSIKMGGGLMQLVAYGAQDIYLTGNPQITFFKVVYRRHTNFSMEAILQTFNGSVGMSSSSVTSTISRNGDLISNMWLDVKLTLPGTGDQAWTYINAQNAVSGQQGPTGSAWTNNTGHAFVKDCEIEIGGQRIDRHYSQWLDIWNELTDRDQYQRVGLNKQEGHHAAVWTTSAYDQTNLQLYIPLQFWFCRNPGLALPLIALQYHEVKLKLTTRNLNALLVATGQQTTAFTTAPTAVCNLWVDYIYLDTDERRRFAQVSHEYLIEQVQRETGAYSSSQKLNFNHPVKELIWVNQDASVSEESAVGSNDITPWAAAGAVTGSGRNDYFNYLANSTLTGEASHTEVLNNSTSYEGFDSMRLQLNGHDRFAKRKASYFRTCQPIQAGHRVPGRHIYCYSFALKPEEHQPSGTCNFSRIDTAKMMFDNVPASNTTNLTVYAVNYNVLRIMSGMGGLAYSN